MRRRVVGHPLTPSGGPCVDRGMQDSVAPPPGPASLTLYCCMCGREGHTYLDCSSDDPCGRPSEGSWRPAPAAEARPQPRISGGWGAAATALPRNNTGLLLSDPSSRLCAACGIVKTNAAFAKAQRKVKVGGARCRDCLPDNSLLCAGCGVPKEQAAFSKAQRKPKLTTSGRARCKDCVAASQPPPRKKHVNTGSSFATGNSFAAQAAQAAQAVQAAEMRLKEEELVKREKALEEMAAHAIDTVNVALFKQEQLQQQVDVKEHSSLDRSLMARVAAAAEARAVAAEQKVAAAEERLRSMAATVAFQTTSASAAGEALSPPSSEPEAEGISTEATTQTDRASPVLCLPSSEPELEGMSAEATTQTR